MSRVLSVLLSPPSLRDNTADADRLTAVIKKTLHVRSVSMDLSIVREIPSAMRRRDGHLRCLVVKEGDRARLIGIQGCAERRGFSGLAVDAGTTRVALRLLDLETSEIIGETGFDNPQIQVAPDVLARIHYADTEGGLAFLQNLIVKAINTGIEDICRAASREPADVYLIAVAGNTAMTHLLMGVTPHWMIREPYIPAINVPEFIRASDLGLRAAPSSRVIIFPNVGSYFGGDLIAGIWYSGMDRAEETAILVDVGTNAEVVLGNKDWMVACAGAAGPALESGVAKMGMMAAPGVIDTVKVDPGTRQFHYTTIGNLPPKGICGSGVIDLAAHLFLSGMLDIRGKLVPPLCGNRYKLSEGMPAIVVVFADESATGKDLIMTQADVDSLIRSKAAMFTILETLALSVGMTVRELRRFFVAGTFGSFINPLSAITIGMIPDLPVACYRSLGNSSLEGAAMALTHDDVMTTLNRIRDRITYLELNVNQELMNRFSAAKFLPHTDSSLFPSIRVWT